MSTSVLYDAPGPRARARVRVITIVVVVLLVLLAYLVFRRLDEAGQLTMEKWGPLIDPNNETFELLWRFLLGGLVNTLKAAGLAIVLSLVIGTLLAVSRVTAAPWYRWAIVGAIELFRGIPVVLLIFFAARVLPEVGINLSLLWYLVIGLTAYNCVVIAEIVRAGLAALPRGQSEAALAIGLTRWQSLRLILLPQAFRVMLPALISQLVVVLKDTSLGFIIAFEELLRRGNIAVQQLGNPIQMYLTIGVIFVTINYGLGKLAEYTERRLSTGRKATPHTVVTTEADA